MRGPWDSRAREGDSPPAPAGRLTPGTQGCGRHRPHCWCIWEGWQGWRASTIGRVGSVLRVLWGGSGVTKKEVESEPWRRPPAPPQWAAGFLQGPSDSLTPGWGLGVHTGLGDPAEGGAFRLRSGIAQSFRARRCLPNGSLWANPLGLPEQAGGTRATEAQGTQTRPRKGGTRTRSLDRGGCRGPARLPRPAPPLARNSGRAAPPGGCTWLALSEGLPLLWTCPALSRGVGTAVGRRPGAGYATVMGCATGSGRQRSQVPSSS